jgi:hypothetical protein
MPPLERRLLRLWNHRAGSQTRDVGRKRFASCYRSLSFGTIDLLRSVQRRPVCMDVLSLCFALQLLRSSVSVCLEALGYSTGALCRACVVLEGVLMSCCLAENVIAACILDFASSCQAELHPVLF